MKRSFKLLAMAVMLILTALLITNCKKDTVTTGQGKDRITAELGSCPDYVDSMNTLSYSRLLQLADSAGTWHNNGIITVCIPDTNWTKDDLFLWFYTNNSHLMTAFDTSRYFSSDTIQHYLDKIDLVVKDDASDLFYRLVNALDNATSLSELQDSVNNIRAEAWLSADCFIKASIFGATGIALASYELAATYYSLNGEVSSRWIDPALIVDAVSFLLNFHSCSDGIVYWSGKDIDQHMQQVINCAATQAAYDSARHRR